MTKKKYGYQVLVFVLFLLTYCALCESKNGSSHQNRQSYKMDKKFGARESQSEPTPVDSQDEDDEEPNDEDQPDLQTNDDESEDNPEDSTSSGEQQLKNQPMKKNTSGNNQKFSKIQDDLLDEYDDDDDDEDEDNENAKVSSTVSQRRLTTGLSNRRRDMKQTDDRESVKVDDTKELAADKENERQELVETENDMYGSVFGGKQSEETLTSKADLLRKKLIREESNLRWPSDVGSIHSLRLRVPLKPNLTQSSSKIVNRPLSCGSMKNLADLNKAYKVLNCAANRFIKLANKTVMERMLEQCDSVLNEKYNGTTSVSVGNKGTTQPTTYPTETTMDCCKEDEDADQDYPCTDTETAKEPKTKSTAFNKKDLLTWIKSHGNFEKWGVEEMDNSCELVTEGLQEGCNNSSNDDYGEYDPGDEEDDNNESSSQKDNQQKSTTARSETSKVQPFVNGLKPVKVPILSLKNDDFKELKSFLAKNLPKPDQSAGQTTVPTENLVLPTPAAARFTPYEKVNLAPTEKTPRRVKYCGKVSGRLRYANRNNARKRLANRKLTANAVYKSARLMDAIEDSTANIVQKIEALSQPKKSDEETFDYFSIWHRR